MLREGLLGVGHWIVSERSELNNRGRQEVGRRERGGAVWRRREEAIEGIDTGLDENTGSIDG